MKKAILVTLLFIMMLLRFVYICRIIVIMVGAFVALIALTCV